MSHDPLAGQKLRMAIPRYAAEVIDNQADYASVLACFVPDSESASILGNMIIDTVFRYLIAAANDIYDAANGNPNGMDTELDSFLARKTRLTGQTLKNFRRLLKQAVLTKRKAERPKKEVADRLTKKQSRYRCYLCGGQITMEEHLDHVWPVNAGGGVSNENLLRAHPECDSAKADLAVCADSALGRFAFSKLPRFLEDRPSPWWPKSIDSEDEFNSTSDAIRAARMRIAVVRHQDFCCFRCGQQFRIAGEFVLDKRNNDEPWWFPNTVAICCLCNLGVQKHADV